MSSNIFVKQASLRHGDRYDYSKVQYVDAKTSIIITCKVHGDFAQKPFLHLQRRNCPKCGYEQRATSRRSNTNWLSFSDARRAVHSLELSTIADWNNWCKTHKPPNIPACPRITYKHDWQGWGDWLGNKLRWLPFAEARAVV